MAKAPAETSGAIPVADTRTGGMHLITEDAIVAGRRAGRYMAVCGVEVLAASLTAPERSHYPFCFRRVAR